VLASASAGDAVTGFALEVRELLRAFGPSEVFAPHVDPRVADEVHELRYYADHPTDGATIVYHASIGNDVVYGFLAGRREPLVLVYHNISPPESFAPYEPALAALLESGRDQVARLRPKVALALAVSSFNADDLTTLGYADVRVIPLIVDGALARVHADGDTVRHLDMYVHGPLALFVGQLLPHKRPELLVEALHTIATYLVPEAHLVLLGARRIPAFAAAVQRQIVELGLANAWIVGSVPPAVLRAYYEKADVFVTASDHEGFCVPLIEAMGFDVPVVARATSAIPETLGGAGILVDASDGPITIGEAITTVATDTAIHDALVARGRARLASFDADAARRRVLDELAPVL